MDTPSTEVARKLPGRLRSTFLLGMIIFVAMNMVLSFTNPIPFDPYKYAYKGWAWWTMDDMRHNNIQTHNVALLGSSLMVSAIANSDANYVNKPLDMALYHKSAYIDYRLQSTFGGAFDTFNISAPGQMPSDAYLTLKAMVATSDRPDIVIYGIAPRDFLDSTLSSPADTEPFGYLRRIVNIDDIAIHVFRTPLTKLNWCLERITYFYGYSQDFRLAFCDQVDKTLNYLVPPAQPWVRAPFTWWDRRKLMPNYMPAEIHEKAIISGPVDRATAAAAFVDNTREYLERYKHPDRETFETQMYFMAKLADYCHKERIDLIIVNMPITLTNVSLLHPGEYVAYLQAIREMAIRNHTTFFDLSNFDQYAKADFHDTVHLNAFGGQKFLDSFVEAVYTDKETNSMFKMAGEELAGHQAIAGSGKARAL